MKPDERVCFQFLFDKQNKAGKHSLEEFNKEELSQLKFNVRKKISGLKQK